MGEWIKYTGTEKLPEIKTGDIVDLIYSEPGLFRYLVKAVINGVEDNMFEATIEKIFVEEGTAEIKPENDISKLLLGKRVKRGKGYIHPVKQAN